MSIRVDVTPNSTVVRCSDCPYWFWAGAGGERMKGHKVAALHEASVHPGRDQARRATEKFVARARNVVPPDGSSERGIETGPRRDGMGDAAAVRGRLPESP